MSEQIHGLSLRDCAEIMSRESALKAQHGEPAHQPHFQQFLAQKGVNHNAWAQSWNGWWARMENDPSGQLHAKFATLQQEFVQAAHLADIPDASQDAKEGVTLEKYAEIQARAAGGEDMQGLVSEAGLTWEQWQKAQTAWNTAMGADVNHHLTTQYGQLYAKYTPGFQQQMQGQVAGMMAGHHAQREAGIPDEPEEEYTFQDMVRELDDPTPNTRWTAAHHIANQWDIGDKSDPQLQQAAQKAAQLARECLERFDDFTVSNAEALARDLALFLQEGLFDPSEADDLKGDIERARNRAQERLATHQAAFEPIRDKAVPERVKMQSAIQDYTSLVEELNDLLEDWEDNIPDAESSVASSSVSAAGARPTPGTVARASSSGGFMATLKRLPVIGAILRMLGL